MSINNSFGLPSDNTKRFGKLFNSIDFEFTSIGDHTFDSPAGVVGNFCIGNQRFSVSLDELDRIADTASRAVDSVVKKRNLGV